MAQLNDPTQPGGLVGVPLKTSTTGYNASTAGMVAAQSQGYTPTATTVTKDQTVQGQIAGIVDSGSPLMQQAERRANQQMVGRGLLNSSAAVGAGQSALYDAALPIAQQDAQTYATSNQKTVDAQNAEANFRAGAANQASLTNAQLGTDLNKSNVAAENAAAAQAAEAANQARLAQQDVDTRRAMQTEQIGSQHTLASLDKQTQLQIKQMDIHSQTNLTQMENQYRQLLQANQNASTMFQQVAQNIANISIQPNLTMETKNNAIATQLNSLREALAATSDISNRTNYAVTALNLGQYFNASNTQDTSNVARTSFGQTSPSQAYDPNRPGGPTPSAQVPREFDDAMSDWADGGSLSSSNLNRLKSYRDQAQQGNTEFQRYFEEHGINWRHTGSFP